MVSEQMGASQAGNYVPVSYTKGRTMKAGQVRINLWDVVGAHPNTGQGMVWNSPCHFFFELINSLNGHTIGSAHVYKTWGVNPGWAVLANLGGTYGTTFRVRADVTGTGSCIGCGNGEDFYNRPLYTTWKATLEYVA
jgi:hypothetical protein